MVLTYENGSWATWNGPAKLTEARKKYHLEERQHMKYALGICTVYMRPQGDNRCPYAFLCKLMVSPTSSYLVWIRSLPDLFRFLQEIGAKDLNAENTIPFSQRQMMGSYFFNDIESLMDWLEDFLDPDDSSYEHIDHLQITPLAEGRFHLIVIHHTVFLEKGG